MSPCEHVAAAAISLEQSASEDKPPPTSTQSWARVVYRFARAQGGVGLTLERAFGYRIRRHYMKFPRRGRGGIILIDWVLVFRKGASAGAPAALPRHWVTLAPGAVAH